MVGILFALLLASMMAVGSGANFNSTSANPGNVVTAGTLRHITTRRPCPDRRQDQAGRDQTGTVDIENTGDIDGLFSIARTIVATRRAT